MTTETLMEQLIEKWEALPELGCNHCGVTFKGTHECDYEKLKEENDRLRRELQFAESRVATIVKERNGRATVLEFGGSRYIAQPESLAKAKGGNRNGKAKGFS